MDIIILLITSGNGPVVDFPNIVLSFHRPWRGGCNGEGCNDLSTYDRALIIQFSSLNSVWHQVVIHVQIPKLHQTFSAFFNVRFFSGMFTPFYSLRFLIATCYIFYWQYFLYSFFRRRRARSSSLAGSVFVLARLLFLRSRLAFFCLWELFFFHSIHRITIAKSILGASFKKCILNKIS